MKQSWTTKFNWGYAPGSGFFGSKHDEAMKQKITDFEKDEEDHWRAILSCGHRQHVRHDPPLTTREWVLTPEGRASRVGFELECKRCDEEPDSLHD